MQFKGLKATTLIMSVMNLAGFGMIDWNAPYAGFQAAVFGVIIAITFIVLLYYWKRKNWARILVMIGAAVAVLNVYFIADFGLFGQALIASEFIFGVFMLWWLNTQVVKSWFKNP